MDQTTLRGSRAYVPKPGHYLFDKIRQEHTGICSSDRTREWVNNVPDIKGRRQPEKRRVLQELHNNRVSRQRTITPRSMATRPTSAAQSKNKGKYKEGEQLKRPEENPGYVHSQRSTRSTKRHTTALENVKEGSGDEDPLLEKSHDHSPTDLAVPMLSSISLDTVSELIYHSKSKRSSSPPKISTTSRGSSPSKGITTERLALYVPRIKFTGYFEQARKPHLLTEPVRTLWKEFIRPCGEDSSSIPIQLKDKVIEALDTPEKSRIPPPRQAYAERDNYSEVDLAKIFTSMEDILEEAGFWRARGVSEPHWCDQVVSPLLNLVRRLECSKSEVTERKPKAVALNITTLDIQPPDLFPYPGSSQPFRALNRKIDYAMGLILPDSDLQALERAVYTNETSVPSINQTDRFANFIPMFLNIEVKRRVTDVDPQIQLAVWVIAEFKKRAVEGYNRNMPVVTIAITGDVWDLWMAYEPSWDKLAVEEVTFLGPISMGSTRDWQGIFSILRYLVAIINWGRTEYYQWFDQGVMNLYRPRTDK